MSTRAERRLREAQTTLEQATQAHQTAAAALAAIEDRAVSGEDIDPLELAGAQGDAGIKTKRVQPAQAAVDAEQATVDEEKARARHRELVEATKATQADSVPPGCVRPWSTFYGAPTRPPTQVRATGRGPGRAWGDPVLRTRQHGTRRGEVPHTGQARRSRLPGPDPYRLARDLRELADRMFEDLGIERARARPAGQEVPVSWQARGVEAGVEAAREDQRRCTPEATPDSAA